MRRISICSWMQSGQWVLFFRRKAAICYTWTTLVQRILSLSHMPPLLVFFFFHMNYSQDIEVPKDFGTSLISAISSHNSGRVASSKRVTKSGSTNGTENSKGTALFSERLMEAMEERKLEYASNPIMKRAAELFDLLEIVKPNMDLRVKNGYFKFTQTIDESADKDTSKQQIETVYNGAPVQGLWQKMKNIVPGKGGTLKTVEHYPMKNVNLYFEQGKTYLVLGAPRCGKSTLLRMIAGILPEDKTHEVGGEVKFNKFNPKSKEVVWSNLVGYIDQIDRLHPFLTVKETCEFAWRCRTGGTHKTPFQHAANADATIKELDDELYTVMTVLESAGLSRVKDTFVGDQQTVRGVSGGEKKRVTVSEMSVGGSPILCMDEISTGLDGE